MNETERARAFAVKAHGDQRYGKHPYIKHLDDVARICEEHAPGQHWAAPVVAYLHDVLEDTAVTSDDLHGEFGDFIAFTVSHLTDPPGKNRRERKLALYDRLSKIDYMQSVGPLALLVKAADRLANVRACIEDPSDSPGLLEMYRGEHEVFRAAVYRDGLCDGIWGELDRLMDGETG